MARHSIDAQQALGDIATGGRRAHDEKRPLLGAGQQILSGEPHDLIADLGARDAVVERFGENAVVLVFFSGHLEQRHREMREAGASWDHPGYYPHVTISYDAGELDLAKVEPYRGELRFGPEIFEPIVEDWQAQIREASFAAPAGPQLTVDRTPADNGSDAGADDLIDQLIAESGYRAAKALTDPILGTIRTADSAAELARLLDATPGDERGLAQSIENASFAMRLDVEAGETNDG